MKENIYAIQISERFFIKKKRYHSATVPVGIYCSCKVPDKIMKRKVVGEYHLVPLGRLTKNPGQATFNQTTGRWEPDHSTSAKLSIDLTCRECHRHVSSSDIELILSAIYLNYGKEFYKGRNS